MKTTSDLKEKILELKKRENAVILAHYYQEEAIQEIADFVGDSLELSRKASQVDADGHRTADLGAGGRLHHAHRGGRGRARRGGDLLGKPHAPAAHRHVRQGCSGVVRAHGGRARHLAVVDAAHRA